MISVPRSPQFVTPSDRVYRPTPIRPCINESLYDACLAGREPAEQLPPRERERLLFELWTSGWTDLEMSIYTKLSLYTTSRIRERLELEPRRSQAEAA